MLWEVKRSAASGGALWKEKKRTAVALCCIVGGRDQGDGGALRQGERERGDSGGAGVRGAWTGLGMQVDAGFHKPASAAPQKKSFVASRTDCDPYVGFADRSCYTLPGPYSLLGSCTLGKTIG